MTMTAILTTNDDYNEDDDDDKDDRDNNDDNEDTVTFVVLLYCVLQYSIDISKG